MITLEGNNLTFRFPEVHESAKSIIQFHRTLRIPDDGKHYPLPPGLGTFPLRHVEDFADRVPEGWRERVGVMMPLYQAEAMWISFDASWRSGGSYPLRYQGGCRQDQRHQRQTLEARTRRIGPRLSRRAGAALARRLLRG